MLHTTHPAATTTRAVAPVHYHALDGLRGIAVLAVLGYHFGASFMTGGYLGVDVFFVISGFVVTQNLIRVRAESGWATHFYGRRVSRLYPSLVVALGALGLVWIVEGDYGGDQLIAGVGALLMSYNLALLYGGAEAEGALHLWSLGVEWHFYLLAPLLLAVGPRSLGRRGRAAALVGLAGIVAVVRLLLLGTNTIDSLTAYLNTFTRLDGLLLGAALAVAPAALLRSIPARRLLGLMVGGVLAAMIIGPVWAVRSALTLGFVVPLVGVLTAGTVLAVLNGGDGSPRSRTEDMLQSQVLVWTGQRSYSLYLAHYFIGVTLIAQGHELWQGWPVFVLQVAASLLGAELLYRFVERPARRAINNLL